MSPSQGRYLYKQNKHGQTTMPWVGFEPTMPAFELATILETIPSISLSLWCKMISRGFLMHIHKVWIGMSHNCRLIRSMRWMFTPYTSICSQKYVWNNGHVPHCRSQWPRGLRHELSSPAEILGSWVRIQLKAWMSKCDYSVFVSSGVKVAALRRTDSPPLSPTAVVKNQGTEKAVKVREKDCRTIDR
jgi:hypothetical protein